MEKWLLSSIHTLNMGYEHFFISNFKDFPGTLSFFAGSGSGSFLPGSRPVTNFFTSGFRIRINMIRIRHTGYVYVSESGPINSPNIALAFFYHICMMRKLWDTAPLIWDVPVQNVHLDVPVVLLHIFEPLEVEGQDGGQPLHTHALVGLLPLR